MDEELELCLELDTLSIYIHPDFTAEDICSVQNFLDLLLELRRDDGFSSGLPSLH